MSLPAQGSHGLVAALEPVALWRYGARGPAKRAGVRIGLGSDWSPSGSKNLLGELKVATLVSESRPRPLFGARELVAMATRNGADILKWSSAREASRPANVWMCS